VSTNKVRLAAGKYNLDLTYITNRIIACGFPAEGFESIYRNNATNIVAFLKEHHGSMVKIYNLCAEERYQYSVERVHPFSIFKFPFPDHNVTHLQKVFFFLPGCSLVPTAHGAVPQKEHGRQRRNSACHCRAL